MLARIEQAKNRGEDYSIADILQLRRICQEGGVSVRPKTVGAQNAIYKAAVDAAVMYAQDRTNLQISLGDGDSECPETRLLSALAADLNLSEERAVALIRASTAAACRARLLDVSPGAWVGLGGKWRLSPLREAPVLLSFASFAAICWHLLTPPPWPLPPPLTAPPRLSST
jgi:hypothetical protein